MRNTTRFEYKYLLSLPEYYLLRNALMPFVVPDEYTLKSPQGRYLVRSLYYDSHTLKAFHERDEGIFGRIKLRLRVYTNQYNDNETLSVELKTKQGLNMTKFSTLIPLKNYQTFLKHQTFDETLSDPVIDEFLRLKHVRNLTPQLIVEYEREGYQTKYGPKLRLTFDHDVSSARAKTLFDEHLNLKLHRPNHVIFEIKCEQVRPAWIINIIKKIGLKVEPNSKYVQGIEITRPMMITPQDDYLYVKNLQKNFKKTPDKEATK